jgi:hypothetical protein
VACSRPLDPKSTQSVSAGDDSDEILGESTTRSQSPYDPAIHTMEEVDVPNSSPVHGEPGLGGGVGGGVHYQFITSGKCAIAGELKTL